MQINHKLIKKHFEKSMEMYDKNAVVQQILAELLICELSNVSGKFSKILELGTGTGLLTKEIKKNIGFDTYIANDLTERSKFYLDKILKNYTFICGNAEKIKPGNNFDLIISNAMFQWFSDLKTVIDYYSSIMKSKGILAFTTFSQENFREIKNITGLSLEYKTISEIKTILLNNYEILHINQFDYVMSFNNPLEVLAHMKHTGVNSLGANRWTVAEVKDFCEKYRKIYPEISLTYSPIIVIAQKNK